MVSGMGIERCDQRNGKEISYEVMPGKDAAKQEFAWKSQAKGVEARAMDQLEALDRDGRKDSRESKTRRPATWGQAAEQPVQHDRVER